MQKNNFSLSRLLVGAINLTFSFAAIGLFVRLFLRLFGANPEAGFTRFIYESTSPLLQPFRGVFTPYVVEPGNVLEISTILALVIYLVVAYLLSELIIYISERKR